LQVKLDQYGDVLVIPLEDLKNKKTTDVANMILDETVNTYIIASKLDEKCLS
jgi:hypothetical protein